MSSWCEFAGRPCPGDGTKQIPDLPRQLARNRPAQRHGGLAERVRLATRHCCKAVAQRSKRDLCQGCQTLERGRDVLVLRLVALVVPKRRLYPSSRSCATAIQRGCVWRGQEKLPANKRGFVVTRAGRSARSPEPHKIFILDSCLTEMHPLATHRLK